MIRPTPVRLASIHALCYHTQNSVEPALSHAPHLSLSSNRRDVTLACYRACLQRREAAAFGDLNLMNGGDDCEQPDECP